MDPLRGLTVSQITELSLKDTYHFFSTDLIRFVNDLHSSWSCLQDTKQLDVRMKVRFRLRLPLQ